MGNTQYAVCHLQRGSGNDSGMSCHIERKDAKGKKYIPFNADANRTHLNRELVKFPDGVKNRTEAIQFRIDHAGLHRKVGKNQTKAIRIILTGTHEQMMKIADDGKLDKWIDANMKWLKDTFGSENLVSCVLHLDEKTPHLHATIVPIATLMLGEMAKKAGVPDGVLNIITGSGRVMGTALVENPITKMVTMTGSTPAGQAIYRSAAKNIIHVQLELGGKAPFIVFDDADIDAAVDAALSSRFDNCGQVCTCNERLYLHESIYDEFMAKFMEKVKAIKVGDPFDPTSDMGPKVNKNELEHMKQLVEISLKEGATLACGGKVPEGEQFQKGNWFEPTVLTDVKQNMTIVHEESFGPILPVLKFSDYDEVINYANDCEYGLAAMVFTNDLNRVMKLNTDLEFGEIYVNRPHGELHQGFHNGYKLSGAAGEDGKYGFEQYLEKKTFYIRYKE
jgi:hypothetical protein